MYTFIRGVFHLAYLLSSSCCCKYQNFIVFMAEYYSNVCIYHILLIQSPVDGHLGCFYFLATVNNAAMNFGVKIAV